MLTRSAGNNFPIRISYFIALVAVAPVVSADPIDELRPGHWYEAPNSAMAAAAPRPAPPGVEGPEAVITGASGGAYDTKRETMIVWGGGHGAYSGNEVYGFDLKTFKWRRITEPSKDVGGYEISGYYPDGKPRGRHTYDFIEYVPPLDRFCTFGGAGIYPGGQAVTGNVDCLDLDSGKWERKANALSYGIGATSGYDPMLKRVWVHGSGNYGFLNAYDPVNNRWNAHGRRGIEDGAVPYSMTADVDPVRRKYVAVGSGQVYVWDIESPAMVRSQRVTTTGASEIVQEQAPGFVYDPTLRKFVAWHGGTDVYVLDIGTLVWTKLSPAPGNAVKPSLAAVRGTFGRFRYIPSKNAYIVVNGLYDNVYLYKLPTAQKSQ